MSLKRTGENYVVNRKCLLIRGVDRRGFFFVTFLLRTVLLLGEEVKLASLLVLVRVIVFFGCLLDRLKVKLTNSEIEECSRQQPRNYSN